ncbi:MAG: phosphoribosyltransferase [Burkholderiaceae bacterium]|nr:phosphoribosyltransferase [Burkholderiaceae bacterium]
MTMRFADRRDAGRRLAHAVLALKPVDPVVLALPRGGVPVAVEVAHALGAPLDLLLVRKIGAPDQRELAVAAIAEGPGGLVLDEETMAITGTPQAYVEREAQRERAELARRRTAYLGGRAAMAVEGKTAVVVDDGIATGTTVRAALQALRARRPARVVLAVPVAPTRALLEIDPLVDDLVCLSEPPAFYAVGAHYDDFRQVSDDEVIAALAAAAAAPASRERSA